MLRTAQSSWWRQAAAPARSTFARAIATRAVAVQARCCTGSVLFKGPANAAMALKSTAPAGVRALSGGGAIGGPPPPPQGPPAGGAPAQGKVFEVNESNFMQVVMETEDVVVLDCAASWCGPCKELTPKLAAAVQQTEGMRLAIMDVDECQQIAAQLQVESVPTVFGVYKGKVHSKIQGNQTNEAIVEFISGLSKLNQRAGAQELLKAGGEALSEGRVEEALRAYGEVLTVDKDTYGALALSGMALCALALKDLPGAKQLVESIQRDYKGQVDEPIVKQAITAVDVATSSMEVDADELVELQQALEKDPDNHDARRTIALALFGRQEYTVAMSHALEIIKRDKSWDEDGGRKLLFKFFDTLGSQHPEVQAARKRLALLLF
mmetsp:Transcript_50434/g.118694  ORF Transcript_50434/g.118694 Transcript_50434/m.118694 type:complete len:380 (-) Transcript_50434:203-1342(-)